MTDKRLQLAHLIQANHKILFFGGAGVSTESGIPDYRSETGLYTIMEKKTKTDASKTMNINHIVNHPVEFFNHQQDRRDYDKTQPNDAHKILAKWEQGGKDVRVVTQNVDGLHRKAGHMYVAELHGNEQHWFCMACGRRYPYKKVYRDDQNVPRCVVDGGLVRPNVTYFGEHPKEKAVEMARQSISQADLLIIAGTSLKVSPAKSLLRHYAGEKIVVINHDELRVPNMGVDLYIQESVGECLRKVDNLLEELNKKRGAN